MTNLIFIAIIGFLISSSAKCETFKGDLITADDEDFTYNGLNVEGKWFIIGSSNVDVIGDAIIKSDLIYAGDGDILITGVLTVKGNLQRVGSGKFKAKGGIVN